MGGDMAVLMEVMVDMVALLMGMEVMEDTVVTEVMGVMGDMVDLLEVIVDTVARMVAMEDMDMEREKLKLQLLLSLPQMPLMGMEVMEDMEDMVALMVAMEVMDMENKAEPRIHLQTDVKCHIFIKKYNFCIS